MMMSHLYGGRGEGVGVNSGVAEQEAEEQPDASFVYY